MTRFAFLLSLALVLPVTPGVLALAASPPRPFP